MYSNSTPSNRLPFITFAGVTIFTIAASTVFRETLVKEYGWEGALRYLWEGEPYSPSRQLLLNSLSSGEKARIVQEDRLNHIEEALERARLDSIDDAGATKAIVLRWAENYKPQNLEKTLAGLSVTLDKLAAQVDAVLISKAEVDGNCRVVQELKRRKKILSKQLVLDMERCDAFLACYQVLQE